MNSISLYFLLVLIYLGLSRSLGLTQENDLFIKSPADLGSVIDSSPMNIILVDMEVSGVQFKSYFHKYRIVFGNGDYKDYWFKVSPAFYFQNTLHLGLSLFRRYQKSLVEETTPMTPGSFFLGDMTYGHWVETKNDEEKFKKRIWKFHDLYHRIPSILGIEDLEMDWDFYTKIKMYQQKKIPYNESKGLFMDRVRRINSKIYYSSNFSRFKDLYFSFPPHYIDKTIAKKDVKYE